MLQATAWEEVLEESWTRAGSPVLCNPAISWPSWPSSGTLPFSSYLISLPSAPSSWPPCHTCSPVGALPQPRRSGSKDKSKLGPAHFHSLLHPLGSTQFPHLFRTVLTSLMLFISSEYSRKDFSCLWCHILDNAWEWQEFTMEACTMTFPLPRLPTAS